jgi:hypothetical protein
VIIEDIPDLELQISDSEEEETGAASFARKYNMENMESVSRSEYVLGFGVFFSSFYFHIWIIATCGEIILFLTLQKKKLIIFSSTLQTQKSAQAVKPTTQINSAASEVEAKRTHIAKELYSTEKYYVQGLGVCIDAYQSVMVKKVGFFWLLPFPFPFPLPPSPSLFTLFLPIN